MQNAVHNIYFHIIKQILQELLVISMFFLANVSITTHPPPPPPQKRYNFLFIPVNPDIWNNSQEKNILFGI